MFVEEQKICLGLGINLRVGTESRKIVAAHYSFELVIVHEVFEMLSIQANSWCLIELFKAMAECTSADEVRLALLTYQAEEVHRFLQD